LASDTPVHGFSSYTATSGASLATKEAIQAFEPIQRRAILPGEPVLNKLLEINEYSDRKHRARVLPDWPAHLSVVKGSDSACSFHESRCLSDWS